MAAKPLCMPFFGDLLLEELLREVMPDLRWSPGTGTLSDDTIGGDPMLGVPTNWMYIEVGGHHHTNARSLATSIGKWPERSSSWLQHTRHFC